MRWKIVARYYFIESKKSLAAGTTKDLGLNMFDIHVHYITKGEYNGNFKR